MKKKIAISIVAVALVLCIILRKRIAAVLRTEKTPKGTYRGFFRSPVFWVMVGYTAVSSAVILLMFSLR